MLDGLIYVIGGVSSDDNLSSVECYNPQLKSWSRVASLNLGKGQVSGALLDGQIYAVGGTDDELREGLKTVERYCVGSDKWEPVSPMHTGRGALGIIYRCSTIQNNVCLSDQFSRFVQKFPLNSHSQSAHGRTKYKLIANTTTV